MRSTTYRVIVMAIILAIIALAGMILVLACQSPTETPTVSPIATPTPPVSPLAVEAEAIEPITTEYILSWEDNQGVLGAYDLMTIYEQISDTVDSWAIYSYQIGWRVVQDGQVMATGVATNAELKPATELGTGEYNGPVGIEIPTDRFSGTAELRLKGCWYPDAGGWPILCIQRMFTDTGPPDDDGYFFGQYVDGLPQAVYLPWVLKLHCPPCP